MQLRPPRPRLAWLDGSGPRPRGSAYTLFSERTSPFLDCGSSTQDGGARGSAFFP